MLPKKYRLVKEKDFKILAKQGQPFFTKELGLKYLKNNFKFSRFGLVVANKIDKRSTVRNKIKRRLREIIYQDLNKIKKGFDIIILTKPEIKNLDFWSMKERLEKLLKRAKLLERNNTSNNV
ncbi:MAG: ribonuclease P protein component [Patescibacteria group bacterium]|nr:ribonuclease P protein component [Patescibacteria group bacterium]